VEDLGCLGFVVGITVYFLALGLYIVVVAPFVAGASALYFAGALAVEYGAAVRDVMILHTPESQVRPQFHPGDEDQPAYRQYFFGPATRDLRQVLEVAWPRCQERVRGFGGRIVRSLLVDQGESGLATIPIGITLWIGLVLGCGVAGLVLGGVAALHVTAILVTQGLARALIGLLRLVDTAVLRAKGITGMICPWCYFKNRYPAYECPQCRSLHSDIRPGKFGVVRRRCQCGTRLPTLVLLGSYRLPARCTNAGVCGRQMSDETGRFAEFVLPFFGGQSAGKTRLMAAMIMRLQEDDQERDASVRIADDTTRHSYEVLREVLSLRGYMLGNRPSELPRAHSLLVAIGRFKRLLHIFDAAGERFMDVDTTDELRYLRSARTYLFVLDPLSVPSLWSQLTPHEQDEVDRSLASTTQPQAVFSQSVQTMVSMRAKVNRSRLAVAISKTDLIEQTGLFEDRVNTSDWAEQWLDKTLGLGNLIRAMRNEFRDVRFFLTAAVLDDDDRVHDSIRPLVDWCLQDRQSRRPRQALAPAVPAGTSQS
jgi:Double-GTPase 2